MTHPGKVKLFVPWAKAMVQGAVVGNPDYGKALSKNTVNRKRKPRKRRRKKRKNATKET